MGYKKNIVNLIGKASYRYSTWTVYSDFLALAAISLSNTVDLRNRDKREREYLKIISKYTKKEAELFPEILANLIMALEDEPTDILGQVFMELNLGNKWTGQFFTPMNICRAAGDMVVRDIKEKIDEDGYITVLEPTVGGGAMVIGLALAMEDAGFNYQNQMLVTAVDLDLRAVYMSYIQLSLLGIPATICHGNSLTVDVYDTWHTAMYILGGWAYRKKKYNKKEIKLAIEETGQLRML